MISHSKRFDEIDKIGQDMFFEETKKQDNRMVEKVNDLDEQIKKLSDELGRKVSVDELEEFAGITEDEISNILKLAGEELPPEEK